ncbi:hypothetical protein ABVF61_07275 [Roseibium sp. HPY-6]|uniref:hypothetical protein n=1 Tax=Roseibium sp. HPY-6 TaxID=3229852 RepID=UPI00338D9F40
METKTVSVAGATSLLGQHLLARLAQDPALHVASLHDALATGSSRRHLTDATWLVGPEIADFFHDTPLLPPQAPALAPVLLSFLPDGEESAAIEAQHLERGTRVVTHGEHARLQVSMGLPGVTEPDMATRHLATPNCTTAMCAVPLYHLHARYGVTGVTITALQAISGADVPGLPAHLIHDQVIGHLPGEAKALSRELSVIFEGAFPIDAFAARVPVWRGHTFTMSVRLAQTANADAIADTLSRAPDLLIATLPIYRESFASKAPIATILDIRESAEGALIVLKGDNLEAATTGIMQSIAHSLSY